MISREEQWLLDAYDEVLEDLFSEFFEGKFQFNTENKIEREKIVTGLVALIKDRVLFKTATWGGNYDYKTDYVINLPEDVKQKLKEIGIL